MQWTHLGHAGWLVETDDVRLVFDPILGERYHDGVFEVFPRRRVDVSALRPDVVVVSHRHPDHFDLESLARLQALGSARLLITADDLVARAARRLGFPAVERMGTLQERGFGGTRLLTTPSFCDVVEWGAIVTTQDGTAWNQVDSVVDGPDEVRGILRVAAALLERPALAHGPTLALARWHPILQVDAAISGHIGFPLAAYKGELQRVAALRARAVIPGAAGNRYADDHGWQNHLAYPVPEDRFIRDLGAMCPTVQIIRSGPGVRVAVRAGEVQRLADAPWIERLDGVDDRVFVPFAIPPVTDREHAADSPARALIERWVGEGLGPALARAWPAFRLGDGGCLRLALDVVFTGDARVGWTIDVSSAGAEVSAGIDGDFDVLNRVAAGPLLAVLEGRAHWGRALLGGQMRSVSRAYRVGPKGPTKLKIAPFFVYYWLPYERATERWIEHELTRIVGPADAP